MAGLTVSAAIKLSWPATRQFWEIPILYEDEHLLALDKPSGLLTAPDAEDPDRPSLALLLHTGIAQAKPWAAPAGRTWLMNAHRLDAETTGVLLLAKSKPVLATLKDWFGAENPGRKFTVLARGSHSQAHFELNARLAPHPIHPQRMRVDARQGKRSHTLCEVLEKFAGWTLLQCEPLTDRTHQVRIHLSHAGLPLAGDRLYGGIPLLLSMLKSDYRLKPNRTERPLIERAALHAQTLALPHPATGQPLTITAPWPKDLAVAVKYLRRYALAQGSTPPASS
jgi:RluA family pseudouridine synthase